MTVGFSDADYQAGHGFVVKRMAWTDERVIYGHHGFTWLATPETNPTNLTQEDVDADDWIVIGRIH